MGKYVAKSFRFDEKGLGKVFGRLEEEGMEVLWASGGATGNEVLDVLAVRRKVAKTTVFTVLDRLAKKGLVRKARGGSVYLFEPVYSKDELARNVSKEVLKGVLDLWSGSAISSFVDIVAEDPDNLERLSRLISTKRRELEEGETR